jgi:hypothetical protein
MERSHLVTGTGAGESGEARGEALAIFGHTLSRVRVSIAPGVFEAHVWPGPSPMAEAKPDSRSESVVRNRRVAEPGKQLGARQEQIDVVRAPVPRAARHVLALPCSSPREAALALSRPPRSTYSSGTPAETQGTDSHSQQIDSSAVDPHT